MKISKIGIRNFRLLKDSNMDFNQNLCMMIGRNNSGKTSFMILMDKFYNSLRFDYNDFSLSLREKINNIDEHTDLNEISIKLIIEIVYDEKDNLCNLSEFIQDLNPDNRTVKIMFECTINKKSLLSAISKNKDMPQEKFIKKYIHEYLQKWVYLFQDESDFEEMNRYKLIKKDISDVKKLIDFDIIHAKRSVTSSEEKTNRRVLSGLTTKFFNDNNINTPDKFEDINRIIVDMDNKLNANYEQFFSDFLLTSKSFLNLENLKIISNLKASEIVNDSSEVIYGDDKSNLPEYLNGLGYMNILYLLLSIEIRKSSFNANKKDIKLLYIEEPEAHTHPQLQCVFARKISEILCCIKGLQTIISTHSSHIVSNIDFENIRYLLVKKELDDSDNVVIKNFHSELKEKYTDFKEFQFIKQYLTIEAADLFFANKIIFIEGTSENMLLPLFISNFDSEQLLIEDEKIRQGVIKERTYKPISTQNISILQVGANAKAFRHFVEFLDIKTLIITDIDTVKYSGEKNRLKACSVSNSPDSISNQTVRYYYKAPDFQKEKDLYSKWIKDLISNTLVSISKSVKVAYEIEENGYHARSFEDAFISINFDNLKKNSEEVIGLTDIDELDLKNDFYEMTEKVLDKKSDFAASLLYLAHTKNLKWNTPKYIKEGLEWIQK